MRQSILLLVSLCFLCTTQAQTTKGTEFWLGYMENIDLLFNGDPLFTIEVTADVTTAGSINVPTTGLSIPFTATGGTTTEVQFPQAIWYSEGSESIDNKGIQILTDNPVSVIGVHYRVFFSDATQVLPTTELGTLYYPTCYETDGFDSASAFNIVATADNTEIAITPSTLTFGLYPADIPYTITLNAGQNYQVQASLDLTGSKIESLSGQPIAVFSGMRDGEVACGYTSHAYDQSLPVDMWGEHYYYVPFKDRVDDQVVIVAQADNTSVFLDCEQVATLNTGESFQTSITEATIINASAPISVAQFVSGSSCNNELGDPNMLQLNPTNRQGYGGTFFASNENMGGGDTNFSKHCFNVVTRTTDIAAITLDGSSIANQFATFPANPDFSYAQIDITAGIHQLVSSELFHAYQYSTGLADAYTASLGYEAITNVDFDCLAIEADGIYCVDSTITFMATGNFDIAEYNWDFGNMMTSNEAMPSTTYSAAGQYEITLEAITSTGNSYFDTLTIDIAECDVDPCSDLAPVNILAPMQLCAATDFEFSYETDAELVNFDWQFGDTGASSLESPTYAYPTPGNYTITLQATDALNCIYEATFDIEITDCSDPCFPGPELEIFVAGNLCVGEPITFSTNINEGPNEVELLFASFAIFPNQQFGIDTVATGIFLTAAEYTITFTASATVNGVDFCDYFGQINIVIEEDCDDPCDDIQVIGIQTIGNFCVDEEIIFDINPTVDFASLAWQFGNGDGALTLPATSSFNSADSYTVNFIGFDANGCEYVSNAQLNIEDCIDPCENTPDIQILQTGVLCVGEAITFDISPTIDFEGVNWQLSNGNSSSDLPVTTTYAIPGIYPIEFIGLDANGCLYNTSIQVEIEECDNPCDELPELSIVSEGDFCADSLITFSANTAATLESYSWVTSNGQVSTEPTAIFDFPFGNYSVDLTVFDENNCLISTVEVFDINDCIAPSTCQLSLPNAFSPNNDNENDRFGAIGDCPVTNFQLQVYNRWGGLVFETNDSMEEWDGNLKGQRSPMGVYVWLVSYDVVNGSSVRAQGDVTLLR